MIDLIKNLNISLENAYFVDCYFCNYFKMYGAKKKHKCLSFYFQQIIE